jgi:hypothetical protein
MLYGPAQRGEVVWKYATAEFVPPITWTPADRTHESREFSNLYVPEEPRTESPEVMGVEIGEASA